MQLLKFYEYLLHDLGLEVKDDGKITPVGTNDTITVPYHHPSGTKVKGQLYLPIDALLDQDEDKSILKFHPACENTLRDIPSDVHNMLTKMLRARLSYVTLEVTKAIVAIIAEGRHESVPTGILYDAIIDVTSVSKSERTILSKIGEHIMAPGNGPTFIAVKYEHDIELDEVGYRRACRVRPIVNNNFDLEEGTVYGIKAPSKRSLSNIYNILKTIYPDEFVGVTNNKTAGYFVAYLNVFAKVAKRLSRLVSQISKLYELPDDVRFGLEWVDHIDTLSKMTTRDLNLSFPGNEGRVTGRENEPNTGAQTKTMFNDTARQQSTSPASNQSEKTGVDDVAERMRKAREASDAVQYMDNTPAPQNYPRHPQYTPPPSGESGQGKTIAERLAERNLANGIPPQQNYDMMVMPPNQGMPPQGYPQQGYPQQGYPNQGYPHQGYPQQGMPQQGYMPPGQPPQGYMQPQQSYPQQGYPNQGMPPQGYPQQGHPNQGFVQGNGHYDPNNHYGYNNGPYIEPAGSPMTLIR